MYKVIKFFTDLQDNNQPYNVGDDFPRKGLEVTAKRLEELVGSDNKQGEPLIQLEEEVQEPAEVVEDVAAPPKQPSRKALARKPAAKKQ